MLTWITFDRWRRMIAPGFVLRRFIRRGDFARALRHSRGNPPLDFLSQIGLHLSVLDRRAEARNLQDRLAVAIAHGNLGEIGKVEDFVAEDSGSLSPAMRRRLASAVALWSPALALPLLPENNSLQRAACFASLGDVNAARRELAAVGERSLESVAVAALLDGRDDPATAWRQLDEIFSLQGWRRAMGPAGPDAGNLSGRSVRSLPTRESRGRVSVVMPAFNAERTIGRAIRSVLDQSHEDLELIVVDDASTDATLLEVQRATDSDRRVRVIAAGGERKGAPVARNRALAAASGTFVTFHDADDWSHPDRLSNALNALETSGALAVVSSLVRVAENGSIVAPRVYPVVRLNPSSLMMRAAVVERLGGFDPVQTGADTEYLARIVAAFGTRPLLRDRNVSVVALLRDGSLSWNSPTAVNDRAAARERLAYREIWMRRHAAGQLSAGQ